MAANGLLTFHMMGATIVQLNGNRALAETSGAIHVIRDLDGVGVDATSYARLYNRVERRDGQWRIAGFRVIYMSDTIVPLDPTRAPELDRTLLASYRPPYRFVSYLLAKSGPRATCRPGRNRQARNSRCASQSGTRLACGHALTNSAPAWLESAIVVHRKVTPMQRYAQVIQLRPEDEAVYVREHAAVWPSVLATIADCNIRNYSIFLRAGVLFAYFEYHGVDYAADMKKMAACLETQRWWAHHGPHAIPHDRRLAG